MPAILLVVPALNEANNIRAVLTDLRSRFPQAGIVVDDGSTDPAAVTRVSVFRWSA